MAALATLPGLPKDFQCQIYEYVSFKSLLSLLEIKELAPVVRNCVKVITIDEEVSASDIWKSLNRGVFPKLQEVNAQAPIIAQTLPEYNDIRFLTTQIPFANLVVLISDDIGQVLSSRYHQPLPLPKPINPYRVRNLSDVCPACGSLETGVQQVVTSQDVENLASCRTCLHKWWQ